jgi:hypothetical protein
MLPPAAPSFSLAAAILGAVAGEPVVVVEASVAVRIYLAFAVLDGGGGGGAAAAAVVVVDGAAEKRVAIGFAQAVAVAVAVAAAVAVAVAVEVVADDNIAVVVADAAAAGDDTVAAVAAADDDIVVAALVAFASVEKTHAGSVETAESALAGVEYEGIAVA